MMAIITSVNTVSIKEVLGWTVLKVFALPMLRYNSDYASM